MNISRLLWWSLVLLLAFGLPLSAFSQGPLTPPGGPAPTMKSLDQIEARTPISSAPFTISAGGSYYLTKNVSVTTGDAITIATGNVTLDLNGFTISSTAANANGTAILINSGLRNIAISNGFIQSGVVNNGGTYGGTGFANGVNYSGTGPANISVSHLSVVGVLNGGILLGTTSQIASNARVESCAVHTSGSYGILAGKIKDSIAVDIGIGAALYGIEISDSRGLAFSSGDGIEGVIVQNCSGASSTGEGIRGSTVSNSYGQTSTGTGIRTETAINCYAVSGTSDGIYADRTATNCYARGNRAIYGVEAVENCSGYASGSHGIATNYLVTNSLGISTSGAGISAVMATNSRGMSNTNHGISSTMATNCFGSSNGNNRGISCDIANGCYGSSNGNSEGIFASYLAVNSYGQSNTGTGLRAHIANSCYSLSNTGPAIIYDLHYNMPPNNYPSP